MQIQDWGSLLPKPPCKIFHLRTAKLIDWHDDLNLDSEQDFDNETDEDSASDDAESGIHEVSNDNGLDEFGGGLLVDDFPSSPASSVDGTELRGANEPVASALSDGSACGDAPTSPKGSSNDRYASSMAESLERERLLIEHQSAHGTRNIALGDASDEHYSDIVKCARWAFSAGGFPSLQIFAFGDFSHDGRHARHNLLLCREAGLLEDREPSVRALAPNDHDLWDLVRAHKKMLAACAVDPLMM